MDIATFNWVDYTILVVVGISTLISIARGFIREAISLVTWILAIWFAYKYGHDFGQHVLTELSSDQARTWIGAGVIFFAILIAGALVNYGIGQFIYFTGLSAIDRILGMAFGFVRGILLVAVLLLIGEIMQTDHNPWWKQSQVIPQFVNLTGWLKGFVPEEFERLKEKEAAKNAIPAATPVPAPATTQQPSTLEGALPNAAEIAKQSIMNSVAGTAPAPAPQAPAPAPSSGAPAAAPAPVTPTTTPTTNQ